MKNINLIKTLKIAAGSMLAIIIAQSLNISYSTSAGIITLLSIQNTKKETINVAVKRGGSFFLAILIAIITFTLAGYSPISFGIFLLFFVSISYRFELQDGISVNAVLMTHLLVEKSVSYSWIINEAGLFLIGSSIGIILNLYMPSSKASVVEFQRKVEKKSRGVLENISKRINGEEVHEENINQLFKILKTAKRKAYENMNNTFAGDTQYYIDYIEMRKNQTKILKKIYENIALLTGIPNQGKIISQFVLKISETYHEHNNGKTLLKELNELKINMKNEPLPADREEFENRAILFMVLSDMERFLELKVEFSKQMTFD